MSERFGLSAAMTLPFTAKGAVDFKRLADHARWCLASGCGSVTAFGTTGEGASLGLSAREQVIGALIGAGIDARRSVVGGVSASSMHEAIVQTRLLMDADCRAVLLAPPFYFKGVTDEGLHAWFARVFEKLGTQARDVILYNIPSVTAVPLSIELIGRLRADFPEIVSGVKDSSGDFTYTKQLLAAHGELAILIGDERNLSEGVRLGAQGSISGLANICPGDLNTMIASGRDDARIPLIVEEVLKYPVTPAVKALVAHRTGDASWLNVRPPLVAMDPAVAARLGATFDAIFAAKAA
jgi:4-hydroxy-tetrahydrodipicolinate synthase